MAHIVVLGAGIGGIPMAYELREALGRQHEITVVSDKPYFQFTPSNPWLGVGWRKRDDIVVELEPVMRRQGIEFIASGAEKVEPHNNRVRLMNGETIGYDYLVIATGPELAFDEIEGFGPEGGYTHSVCTVDHAEKAKAAWDQFVADPGPVICGAVQGASCFGPAYEHTFIMETDLRRRKIRDRVPMTFITSEPYIGHLGLGGVGDTKGLLESAMRDRHVKWITNAKIDKFEAGMAHVSEYNEDGNVARTHEVPFKFAMFIPAFRGIPAVRDIEGLVNPRGFILVDDYQRNPTFKNVYSVGVCIAIPPLEKTPVPVGVPKTGYMIESMVTAAVQNIKENIDGKEPSHHPTWNALCLADFGDRGVAFVAKPQNPPRNVSWSSEGRWVHYAKIAFEKYFLRKVRKGQSEPFYERYVMTLFDIRRLKTPFRR